MNKFEDDLKYAYKVNGNDFFNYLQSISFELIKQKQYSNGQEFLKKQHLIYEIIFKQNGILNTSFQKTQMRLGSIDDTLFFIKLLNILSPSDKSFYESLPSQYPFNPVQIDILPAHLQLFLKDPSIANMNYQFQTFQEIFQDNILIEKNQLQFCVSAKMMFWIYLLNGAVNFKESVLDSTENNENILYCAFNKYKKKCNTKDFLLQQLTFNPYLILIRRIIESIIIQIKQNNPIQNNYNKKFTIFAFQQMIILLQEYSLYENLYMSKSLGLNLNSDQQRLFYQIKPISFISDTQMMMIYLTIFFNSMRGQELEATYSYFKHSNKNNDIFSKQTQILHQNRGFFFECGRQNQQITYQQGLYKFLQNSFEHYHNERQCNQVSLLSHLSTQVLFLRQSIAKYEISIYEQVCIFEKALESCLVSQNKIVIFFLNNKAFNIKVEIPLLNQFQQKYNLFIKQLKTNLVYILKLFYLRNLSLKIKQNLQNQNSILVIIKQIIIIKN